MKTKQVVGLVLQIYPQLSTSCGPPLNPLKMERIWHSHDSSWVKKETSDRAARKRPLVTLCDAHATMLHSGNGVLRLISRVVFLPSVSLCTKAKKLSFDHIRPEKRLFPFLESPTCLFGFYTAHHSSLQPSFSWRPGYSSIPSFSHRTHELSYGSLQILQSCSRPLGRFSSLRAHWRLAYGLMVVRYPYHF